MKKIVAILLIAVMCISFAACGGAAGGNASIKADAESYIGEWKSEHMIFTISKGYVGRYEQTNGSQGYFDFTWEVKDEILTISIKGAVKEWVSSFELNDDGTELTIIHNGLPGYTEGETTFKKQ